MSQKKSNRAVVDGWVVLDKPVGMTSTQAVSRLKRIYNAQKAGHAGTLDPLASGILPGRLRRGDQDRAFRAGRREGLSLHRALGRRDQ